MLNHLTLGKSLIKQRLDVPTRHHRAQHHSGSRTLTWLHHQVSELLRPLPRR